MNLNEKSRNTSLVLTVLLGPLGLLYASIAWGLVLLILFIITLPTVVVPVVIWVFSIAIGDHVCHKHNMGLKKFYEAVSASKE